MEDLIRYTISMKADVATYCYGKFEEFVKNNPDQFGDLTFDSYIGAQVLASMKLLFEGVVPDTTEAKSDPTEPCSRDGKVAGLGV